MFCPKCGAPCDPVSPPRFCSQCGAALPFSASKQPDGVPTPPLQENAPRVPETASPVFPESAPADPTPGPSPASAKKSRKRMLFTAGALLLALIAVIVLFISIAARKKDGGIAGGSTGQGTAVNPMQLVDGVRSLMDVKSCDFALFTDDGDVHVTGTMERAEDLMDSCVLVRLPDADGKAAFAYLHEGRLMMVRGTDYITGLNIKGVSELLESKGGSTLDSVLGFFKIETTDLTYDDCVVLFDALSDAVSTLRADLDEKERLNDLFSIVMETAIPLLKLRDGKETVETVRDAAGRLLEALARRGVSAEALRLEGTVKDGVTAARLILTPAVFFRELRDFCKESADFASICTHLQTTPEEVLAPYTDEALQSAFGDNSAVLGIDMDEDRITGISADYGGRQAFRLTLSNHNAAAVDTARYEFIEDMRSDPAVENNYIDNVFDFVKKIF